MSERRAWVEFTDGADAILAIAAVIVGITVATTWYSLRELEVKREALARGTSPLEIQCMFASERERAACLVILGSRK